MAEGDIKVMRENALGTYDEVVLSSYVTGLPAGTSTGQLVRWNGSAWVVSANMLMATDSATLVNLDYNGAYGFKMYGSPAITKVALYAAEAEFIRGELDTSVKLYFPQLTSNGFLKTSGSNGYVTVDTATYGTSNLSVTTQSEGYIVFCTDTQDILNSSVLLTFDGTTFNNWANKQVHWAETLAGFPNTVYLAGGSDAVGYLHHYEKCRGNPGNRTYIYDGDIIAEISFHGYDNSAINRKTARWSYKAEDAYNSGSYGSSVMLETIAEGATTLTNRFGVAKTGNVYFGNSAFLMPLTAGTQGQALRMKTPVGDNVLEWFTPGTGSSNVSIANQADNRLITATGTTDALNAEANLTFSGSLLSIAGAMTVKGEILLQSNSVSYGYCDMVSTTEQTFSPILNIYPTHTYGGTLNIGASTETAGQFLTFNLYGYVNIKKGLVNPAGNSYGFPDTGTNNFKVWLHNSADSGESFDIIRDSHQPAYDAPSSLRLVMYNNGGTGGVLIANKTIGVLKFTGSDGTSYIDGATILSGNDTDFSTGVGYGDLRFYTNNGSANPTERMKISQSGTIIFGTSTTSYTFPSTKGSNGQALRIPAGGGTMEWYTPASGGVTVNSQGQYRLVTCTSTTDTLQGEQNLYYTGATGELAVQGQSLYMWYYDTDNTPFFRLYHAGGGGTSLSNGAVIWEFRFVGETNFSTQLGTLRYIYEGNGSTNYASINWDIVWNDVGISLYDGSGNGNIFNPDLRDVDFSVNGDTESYMVYVDAGNDRVGIGSNAPAERLYVKTKASSSVIPLGLHYNSNDSLAFIKFYGHEHTGDASGCNISSYNVGGDSSRDAVSAPKVSAWVATKMIKVNIDGTDYWVPAYVAV